MELYALYRTFKQIYCNMEVFKFFFNFTDGMLHFEFIKVESAWSKEFQTEVCR